MTVKRRLLGVLLVLMLPLVAWVGLAGAQSFQSGRNTTVDTDETIDSSLWIASRNIDVAGTVNGDIYCAGINVAISGVVDGDVICTGQAVAINGRIDGDIRVAAQTVVLSADVAGSVTVAAENFTLTQAANIGRDLSVAAEEIFLNGEIARDVALTGTNVAIDSDIGRDVAISGEAVEVGDDARIGGDFSYTSEVEANIAEEAQIVGDTQRGEPEARGSWASEFYPWVSLFMVLTLITVALVAVLIAPRFFREISDIVLDNPLKTLLVGLVASLVFPLLFVALLVSVIGIPLALLLLLVWLVVLAVGGLSFSFYVGRLLFSGINNAILIMLLGSLVVLVALQLPLLGLLVLLAATWFGAGMVLLAVARGLGRPEYSETTETTE